jgi:molecular chaperone GrpE (heat shock protein)
MRNITLDDILYAVYHHYYPINYNISVSTPVVENYQRDESYTYVPITGKIETIDVREYARVALKRYNTEAREEREKYNKLLREFEDYKRQHREFEEFKRFQVEKYGTRFN